MTPDTETTDTLPNLFRLGLKAFIVDLDGVVTHTAAVHATAWKDLFDAFLKQKAEDISDPEHEVAALALQRLYVEHMKLQTRSQ